MEGGFFDDPWLVEFQAVAPFTEQNVWSAANRLLLIQMQDIRCGDTIEAMHAKFEGFPTER